MGIYIAGKCNTLIVYICSIDKIRISHGSTFLHCHVHYLTVSPTAVNPTEGEADISGMQTHIINYSIDEIDHIIQHSYIAMLTILQCHLQQ